MPAYQYEIQQPNGSVARGIVDAPSVAEATGQLRRAGGYLLNVRPAAPGPGALLAKLRDVKVEFLPGLKDVLNFTNQLAVMIKAGINIRNAMSGIGDQVKNPRFRAILQQIRNDVEEGKPFSEALAKHPQVFSPLYVNMVRASELSGSFGHMLDRISEYLTQQVETRSMIRGAMIYPVIIAVMAVGTTIFLLTFVLPKFTALFAGKESLLPKPTVMLIAISSFLRLRWYIVIAGAAAAIAGAWFALRARAGRDARDRALLKIPLLKQMFRALYITRGLHTMGELVSAGVPMLETLQITADVSGNLLYRRMWSQVHESVKQGKKIAEPLARHSLLPGNVVQMIAAGEESGKLGDVMCDVAQFYSKELRSTIKSVTAMIEPLMIMIMGAIVGFIAMSIILPIFKMSSLVK